MSPSSGRKIQCFMLGPENLRIYFGVGAFRYTLQKVCDRITE